MHVGACGFPISNQSRIPRSCVETRPDLAEFWQRSIPTLLSPFIHTSLPRFSIHSAVFAYNCFGRIAECGTWQVLTICSSLLYDNEYFTMLLLHNTTTKKLYRFFAVDSQFAIQFKTQLLIISAISWSEWKLHFTTSISQLTPVVLIRGPWPC